MHEGMRDSGEASSIAAIMTLQSIHTQPWVFETLLTCII